MTKRKTILGIILGLAIILTVNCQETELIMYKQVDTTKLYLEIHHAKGIEPGDKAPAMIFFFGGGWVKGDRMHFEHHARYFSNRGLTCFLADYRTKNKHGTPPFECLKDAKSAICFIKSNAKKFNIDSAKVIASGGSAGGHLAAATALIDGFNHKDNDLSISCVPDALVLFNPVFDNGPGGYGYDRIGDRYKEFSPLHNIQKGAPPTVVFLGTEDPLIPVETAEYFKVVMEKVGSRCDLHLYEGEKHGFFNYGNKEYYIKTVYEADQFLNSLGYIDGEPVIEIKE